VLRIYVLVVVSVGCAGVALLNTARAERVRTRRHETRRLSERLFTLCTRRQLVQTYRTERT